MADRHECPLKRCDGHLDIAANGTLADGRAVQYGICDRCGKTVELEVQVVDHPTLFGDQP